jgi:RHS repeat-associated protein
VTYKYDALGRRIQRSPSNAATVNYVNDGEDVIEDRSTSGTSLTRYLNGLGIDNKIRQKDQSSGATYYFHGDQVGSTVMLTDASGSVAEQISYSPFGVTAGSNLTRFEYTGRERDSITGWNYYRARWYDADVGRFMGEDPIAFGGGNNWYAYVDNNPLNATDPSGMCANPAYCRKLLTKIIGKTNGFFNRFRRYHDAGFRDLGGKDWSHGGESGITGPGGHYKGLGDRQRGLIGDILEYVKECIKPGDPPPPGLGKAFEAAKKHIPYPANWPTQDELRMQELSNRNMEQVWRF